MDRFEEQLRRTFQADAQEILASPERQASAVSRARFRHSLKTASALCAAGALTVVAYSNLGLLGSESLSDRSPTGPGAASPSEADRSLIAAGEFEGTEWRLVRVMDPTVAHPEDPESKNPEIAFEIPDHPDLGSSIETHESWTVIDEPFHNRLVGDNGYAYGMVEDDVAEVSAELDDGRTVRAKIFDGGETPLPNTDYYVLFLPDGAKGRVVALDSEGNELGSAKLGPAFRRDDVRLCTHRDEHTGVDDRECAEL